LSFFITIEGPDGSGKSTQARLLADHLKDKGYDVLFTREPGGTEIGDQIRRVIMSLDNKRMSPQAEFLLFSASRAQLVREVIQPKLAAGGVVVCDRFYDSSLAYQGYGHQLNLDQLRSVTEFVTGGLVPDLTLLLDLPSGVGLNRRREAGLWNRLDDYDLAFHERVRAGYLRLAEAESQRWVVIDATRSKAEIQSDMQEPVLTRLESQSS
jgi:dTMP kinase